MAASRTTEASTAAAINRDAMEWRTYRNPNRLRRIDSYRRDGRLTRHEHEALDALMTIAECWREREHGLSWMERERLAEARHILGSLAFCSMAAHPRHRWALERELGAKIETLGPAYQPQSPAKAA